VISVRELAAVAVALVGVRTIGVVAIGGFAVVGSAGAGITERITAAAAAPGWGSLAVRPLGMTPPGKSSGVKTAFGSSWDPRGSRMCGFGKAAIGVAYQRSRSGQRRRLESTIAVPTTARAPSATRASVRAFERGTIAPGVAEVIGPVGRVGVVTGGAPPGVVATGGAPGVRGVKGTTGWGTADTNGAGMCVAGEVCAAVTGTGTGLKTVALVGNGRPPAVKILRMSDAEALRLLISSSEPSRAGSPP
jgi:hypothetical protein